MAEAEVLAQTRAAMASFRDGPGQQLQQQLEEFAHTEEEAGRSWLSEAWSRGYLSHRGPLPVSTNVTFQIHPNIAGSGCPSREGPGDEEEPLTELDRAAAFLHRAAVVHLAQARGETLPEIDLRGATLDPGQWACLNGGLRHPLPVIDETRACALGAADREIGIFFRGHLYPVRISDDKGHPLDPGELRAALAVVLKAPSAHGHDGPAADQRSDQRSDQRASQGSDRETSRGTNQGADALPGDGGTVPTLAGGFAAMSSMGSDVLAGIFDAILADSRNAQTCERLGNMLFTLSLTEESCGDAEHLRALAFDAGRAWVRRPLSYEIGLKDDWLAVHVEHTLLDGATLVAVLRRMQEVELPSRARWEQQSGTENTVGEPPLIWHLTPEQAQTLDAAVQRYQREAAGLRVDLVKAPIPDLAGAPFKISGDGVQQLILNTAQHLAFGQVRSVYEAVDMREYTAGRTECLRSVTPQAVAFAQAAAEGTASEQERLQLLGEALEAHRGWVKACKSGQGVDRHLLGLRLMADCTGEDGAPGSVRDVEAVTEFFEDVGIAQAREDFLSTTSVGSSAQILRYAFAPSVPEGFGISYTPHAEHFEFCVTWREEAGGQRAAAFLRALEQASARFPTGRRR